MFNSTLLLNKFTKIQIFIEELTKESELFGRKCLKPRVGKPMKISIRHIVALCLGVFLLKIVVLDPYRDAEIDRAPATVRTLNSY